MAEDDALRAQVFELQIRIAQDRATFEEELSFTRSVIIQLQEDRDWIREVADSREERIHALEAQLSAARLQLEALMKSGSKDKRRIGTVVMTLLTGVSSVMGLSGYSLKDAIDRPNNPLPTIVYTLSPEDCRALGLEQPPLQPWTGTAANPTGTVDVQTGGGLSAEFQAGSGLQDEARTDDSVSSFPQGSTVHDEARTDDSFASSSPEPQTEDGIAIDRTVSLNAGIDSGLQVGTSPADEQENADRMVREFLRQRLNERSDPVRPGTISDALPLGIEQVQSSLTRLLQADAIEGETVEEVDYPVMVTRVR